MIQQKIPFYESAFYSDYANIWFKSPIVNNLDKNAYKNMAYYRAVGCFYEGDEIALEDRRELLYNYLKVDFDYNKVTSPINRYRYNLPCKSNFNKILNNLCTLYRYAPRRNFGEKYNDLMFNLYKKSNIDVSFDDIYKQAKLYGLLAVRPMFINDVLHLQILSPDKFRVKTDDFNFDNPVEITYPMYNQGKVEFWQWTNEDFKIYNEGNLFATVENPYGRIPFVFLRLNQNNNNFYTPALFELVEDVLNLNKIRFLSDLNLVFQGLPVTTIINGGDDFSQVTPDLILRQNDVQTEDALAQIKFVAPAPVYQDLQNHIKSLTVETLESFGIPSNELSTPLSGISRAIQRQELLENRTKDLVIMSQFEEQLANLIFHIYNTDSRTPNNDILDFSIDYDEERLYIEPEKEMIQDENKMKQGLLHPLNYFKKWSDIDNNTTQDDLLKQIKERLFLLNEIENIKKGEINNEQQESIIQPINIEEESDISEEDSISEDNLIPDNPIEDIN